MIPARGINLRPFFGVLELLAISILLVANLKRSAIMTDKLKSIPSLYDDATRLHYQFHQYCKTRDYQPIEQDFADLKIIRDTIKDIEHLTLVLEEFWVEKQFVK